MNFTPEQLTKAKAAKSAEELLALAKENDVELTENEAQKYFAEFHKEGPLADEELDNVAGGCGDDDAPYYSYNQTCPTPEAFSFSCEGEDLQLCRFCTHWLPDDSNYGYGYCMKNKLPQYKRMGWW